MGTYDACDDARGVAVVLGAIGGISLFVNAGVGFLHESDVFFDAGGADVTFVAHLCAAKPDRVAPLTDRTYRSC